MSTQILFDCFVLHGTRDVFKSHPLGDAATVPGELSWPMFEARRTGDQQAINRTARMMSGAVIR